ncbi:MAG: hypothetical protein K1000chlam1_01533 [Candidatus Anoxychlamydiales bacterium]|nr:hypothetical protein [Candidatus Anoxychlamydiales bacterium]
MAAILKPTSHKNMFDNKKLSELRDDATYFYKSGIDIGDKLSWSKKDRILYPIIHKSGSLQGIKRTYDFFVLAHKSDGELSSLAAIDWASKLKEINDETRIEKRAMFEYARLAFEKLHDTYADQYSSSSSSSDQKTFKNYTKARDIMKGILEFNSEDKLRFEKMQNAE